jgi:hypothetical protein
VVKINRRLSGTVGLRADFLEEQPSRFLGDFCAEIMEELLTSIFYFLLIILSYFSLNHGITLSIKSPLINEDFMISFTIILFIYKPLGLHYK